MEKGLTIEPRDCVYLLAQNIGFRKIGEKAGYDSCTLVIPIVVPESTLKHLGFYCNDNDPNKQKT